jgi:hypothetical protein
VISFFFLGQSWNDLKDSIVILGLILQPSGVDLSAIWTATGLGCIVAGARSCVQQVQGRDCAHCDDVEMDDAPPPDLTSNYSEQYSLVYQSRLTELLPQFIEAGIQKRMNTSAP